MTAIHRFVPVLAVFLLAVFSEAAFSAFDAEFDEQSRQEAKIQLPPFPENENLIPFTVNAETDMRFFIDEKSISIGSDEVIRYSLVVLGPSGARNISFEGMRCATVERRVYAFGRADGTWSEARNKKWIRILGSGDSYHVALFTDYFCAIGQKAVMTPEEAIRALRHGMARYTGA
jgi:hypothetical protein